MQHITQIVYVRAGVLALVHINDSILFIARALTTARRDAICDWDALNV